jgi:hypothetical protein
VPFSPGPVSRTLQPRVGFHLYTLCRLGYSLLQQ